MPSSGESFALAAPTLFDGEQFLQNYCLVVCGDRVEQVLPTADCPSDMPLQVLSRGILAPGLVDLQVNGGGDAMLHSSPSVATLEHIQTAHRALGTTSLLPTLLSDTLEKQQAAMQAVTAACDGGNRGILGLHIEGPFFSREKKGAHREDRIREPDAQDIDWLCEPRDFVVLLTLAPEQVRPQEIAQLSAAGVVVCAGHTNASYEQLTAAVSHGVKGVTHLFNAMSTMSAREPGALGAALDNAQLWAGIIADGHHVHPAGIRLAHTAKPRGKLLLVSDAMATVGGVRDSFELYGEEIFRRDGSLVNANGALAGSAIAMIDAVQYSHTQVGLPLEECLRMASLYPAAAVALDDQLGRIAAGYRADLVHFDTQFQVHNTWLAGQHRAHSDNHQ